MLCRTRFCRCLSALLTVQLHLAFTYRPTFVISRLTMDIERWTYLSPPYIIGQAIIFLPCGFFLLLLFSSLNLSGRRLDVYHTWYGLSANLECRSEMCGTRIAENAGPKKSPKIAIWAPSHNFVGLYLRNNGTYRQSEKKLVKQHYLLHTSPQYGELIGPLAAEIISLVWGTPANFSGFRILAALLHGTPVLAISQTLQH